MSGITILTQHPIAKYVGQVWFVLLVILFVVGIGCIIGGLTAKVLRTFVFGWICLLLMLPAGVLAKIYTPKVETGRYEYQVLLDETVDINELVSHYDIIGQDGLIWIIQDKEN